MLAIVTGATSGIGKAIAYLLHDQGYELILLARSIQNLEALQAELEQKRAASVTVYAGDLSLETTCKEIGNKILAPHQTPDILINNLGIYSTGTVLEEDEHALSKMWETNFLPAYHLCRTLVPRMVERRKGFVVNICSVVSTKPRTSAAAYSISKSALYTFTGLLREEVRDFGVKVTAILPGSVNTESWDRIPAPKQSFVQPEDVAQAVLTAINQSKGSMIEEITVRPLDRNY